MFCILGLRGIGADYTADWILATGIWTDTGFWRDNAVWID